MEKYEAIFGQPLPGALTGKLESSGLFPRIPKDLLTEDAIWNAFYADGTPTVPDDAIVYPCYANRYLSRYIPDTVQKVAPGYSRAAAVAALGWVEKLTGIGQPQFPHILGKRFSATINGVELNFLFPLQMVLSKDASGNTAYVPILAIADSASNNAQWENGSIPDYVESQARFLLWCYRQAAILSVKCDASRAIIARITGNSPDDVSIRTVLADPQKEDRLIALAAKEIQRARNNGKALPEMKYTSQDTWRQMYDKSLEDAYQRNDETFYDLVRQYMETRSKRKAAEREANAIKEEMDAIAVALAEKIPDNAGNGVVKTNTTFGTKSYTGEYKVSHVKTRFREPTVSASLVRQLYPNLTDCIEVSTTPRGAISVEAL